MNPVVDKRDEKPVITVSVATRLVRAMVNTQDISPEEAMENVDAMFTVLRDIVDIHPITIARCAQLTNQRMVRGPKGWTFAWPSE